MSNSTLLWRATAGLGRRPSFAGSIGANPSALGLRRFRSAAALRSNPTGLYGFDHLKTAGGFQRFVDDAIERSEELIKFICGMPSSAQIMGAMDEISDTVCSVVDSAELCRQTHPDREYVEEASKAYMRIHEHIHYLNTHHALYHAVVKAEQDSSLLNTEAQRAAHHLRVDFERGGIHLSPAKLDRFNRLNVDVAHLCREFSENIISDPGFIDIFPSSRIPGNLHHRLKPIYRSTFVASLPSVSRIKEKGFRISTDPSTYSSVMQEVSDEEVRKLAYVQGNSAPLANIGVLNRLITARHEIAQVMGYKSYAEYAVHPYMASSPEVVKYFLLQMSDMVRAKADEEFKRLRDFKRVRTCQADVDLEAWDETYFATMMRSSVYRLDSTAIAEYFPLSQCIKGLKVLVESLFGATFHDVPLAPGESWHPDVLKFLLRHPEEGDLGYLYLDLHSRRGKYPGCAHFAIKGGRWISELEYQLPVVALVCNFAGPATSAGARLNYLEVETLFHEFGHALHSLLSRTHYQHFSGTRVVLDLAEVPSNLFEYYAWDYRVLKTFARHYSTGETIPKILVESMQGARKMFAAVDMQQQIFNAMIDQTLYGELPPTSIDSISIVADLKRQLTGKKHVDGTHWHTRFSHLLHYGAGYYTYLYAKCFAATIWQKLCDEDPLSLATGTALRSKFLQHGGAKEPAHLLSDLAGNDILRYHNGGIVPNTASLYAEMRLSDAEGK